MKEKELLKDLRKIPVFSNQDIQRILGSSNEYSKIVLNRLVNRGEIKRVKRNSYTVHDDIFLIATNLNFPSYLSFWSASSYKGYTEQILKNIQVAVQKNLKDFIFENYKIEFIRVSSIFGYKKIKTNEGEIFIAQDERLIIDALEHQEKMGNFDEVENIVRNSKLNKERMVDFLQRNKKQSTIKRVGYLIEKIKKIDISDSFKLDNNYVILNKFSNGAREVNSKWRVKI